MFLPIAAVLSLAAPGKQKLLLQIPLFLVFPSLLERCILPGISYTVYLKTLSGAKQHTNCVNSVLFNGIAPFSE